MNNIERVLSLLALLREGREGHTFQEIAALFPGEYGGEAIAAKRKFERDKREIIELGYPLSFGGKSADEGGDEAEQRYAIDVNDGLLPNAGWTSPELATLYAAGSAALQSGTFVAASDLQGALRKISLHDMAPFAVPKIRYLGTGGSSEDPDQESEKNSTVWSALKRRKRLSLTYQSPNASEPTLREVDPWGVAHRRGVLTLVGYCHLRRKPRVFLVPRILRIKVNTSKPNTPDYEVPPDFSFDKYVGIRAWEHKLHEPVNVRVALRGHARARAADLFGVAPSSATDEICTLTLSVTCLEGLIRTVLPLSTEVQIIDPARAVAAMRAAALAIAEMHEAPTT